jgi:beta-lactam-binding protein with PASTA domain
VRREWSDVPVDQVISTSPHAGEPVARGVKVVLKVSKGPEPTATTGDHAPPPPTDNRPPSTPPPTPPPTVTEPPTTPPETA